MARRRKGRPIDGVLVLDKPSGLSSNAALQHTKRLYRAAKAGHTGSLDPLATGVLPLCFGEATKFSQFLLDADKGYLSTFILGVGTSTADADGETISVSSAAHVTLETVTHALPALTGVIQQIPPMYSALKKNGIPLYKLARKGVDVKVEKREITIHDFKIISIDLPEVEFSVTCSKGTYIRSLAYDFGKELGSGAHLSKLRRTSIGNYSVDKSNKLMNFIRNI